jgi:tryptophan synthase beta chain
VSGGQRGVGFFAEPPAVDDRDGVVPGRTERARGAGVAEPTKILLDESEIPTHWYNVVADLPEPPPPPLHPGTHEPIGPDALAPLFPMALIMQEVSGERYIEIPEAVRDVYALWRPSPLYRAHNLEKLLDTPARIYFKYEGVSPAGSHKPNTAVAQAYYNAQEGVKRLTTETGAGQWGSALAFATAQFGLGCEVWQVAASFTQKPYRASMMRVWGAEVHSSPSELTEAGRAILAQDPDSPGSLGIAISEAVEAAMGDEETKYALGSVLNHVLLHQTVIGEEALLQLAKVDETPDLIVGCTGGGSNFAGLFFPFLREKLAGKMDPHILAVEPAACPSFTKGEYRYDFGDVAGMTPLMKMHTLGHDFIPDPIHAGGLRYHGMSPLLSHMYELGMFEAEAIDQMHCFDAAIKFARTQGIVPAPEPTHALAAAIREAEACKETGEEKVILTALCGHGHFDMAAYDAYLGGQLKDFEYPAEKVAEAMANVPVIEG